MRRNLLSKLLSDRDDPPAEAAAKELERLLNTRNVVSLKEDLPAALLDSLLCYGVPDFTGLCPEDAGAVTRLIADLERRVAAHCPRLKRVSITPFRPEDGGKRGIDDVLFFRIAVVFYGGPSYHDGVYDERSDISATLVTRYNRSGSFKIVS